MCSRDWSSDVCSSDLHRRHGLITDRAYSLVAESRRHGAARPPAGYEVMHAAPATAPLKIDAATGLLAGARQGLSPNFDARSEERRVGKEGRSRGWRYH